MANPIKRLFDLYTSDLSFDEIQRLIKKESAEVYQFFAADINVDTYLNVSDIILIMNIILEN